MSPRPAGPTSPRTRHTSSRGSAHAPAVDVASEAKATLGHWWRSPALDFYAILILGSLLIFIGLIMVLSSSSVGNIAQGRSPYAGFTNQAMYAGIGVLALVVAMSLPLKFLRSLPVAFTILLATLALQAAVFIPGVGINFNGNRNWVRFGSIQGQPSEFLKIGLALWLGAFLAQNRDRLREIPVLIPALAAVVAALGLVVGGRDLGTMMIIAALAAGAMWVAGVARKLFIGAIGLGAVAITALVLTSPNRMARVSNFLHGECPADSCWQSDNGLMALAEGGWWGVGLGQSRQKWGRIPHADNDYIFAIIGEEFGLVGTLTVLALFTALAVFLNRVVMNVRDPFVQITTAAIATWILAQALVNMAVVSGLLPVLGVPLPFVSAGGSALVASMGALGLLLNFARSEPGARDALKARASLVQRSAAVVAPGAREPRRVAHGKKK